MDVLVVCIDSTGGWREANRELVAGLGRAGVSVEVVRTGPVPRVRTFALTDLTQAHLARRAAIAGIARHQPRAIIYCSVTAALLWPRPGAIFLDATAHENRPGRHGIWQRPVENRRLAQAPLLLPWSDRSLAGAPAAHAPAFALPPPIELPSQMPGPGARDGAAITYAGDPVKRRLDRVLDAWQSSRRPGETLIVSGLHGFDPPDGVRSVGRVGRPEFRQLLERSRVFVAAPQREDHGIAALEALACGCRLVTTPAPGAYPALDIARAADPRLVSQDLPRAIRLALDDPVEEYASVVAQRLAPFTAEAIDRQLADVILPRLLTQRPAVMRA
ncbi:MAG TPA: glycosyltransferase [Solirubrobacteraceae bacterium]|nr:glycosyltransferase [Solirubrobacteraceae bacterium]